ncbi:hypothetical protein Syun_017747 [Stephania yunnanensis]|uniref:Strictosidine synthase conserved region domain-containing protein n=1 Tax=Stephania yunnanensis TaxID=152371 RepID=A0AAP0P5E6_9MAGN
MKKIILAGLAILTSILFAADPIRFIAPKPIKGSLETLKEAQTIELIGAVGPESLAFDINGDGPYTGVGDGRVLKWREGHGWSDFAFTSSNRTGCVLPFAPEMEHVCGRPLGLRFHPKTGDLYIADAYLGLQVVGSNGGLATQILTEAENEPFKFTNDLDIDEVEDVIYFTDTSTRFQRRQFVASVLTGDDTGRLMKYDLVSQKVQVLLRGLKFANGVALSKDRSFVLVAETTSGRILRLWVHGPKAGTSEIFAELPGFPDNIRRNSKGEFWVALHSKKGIISNFIQSNIWFGKALLKSPLSFRQLHALLIGFKAHAIAVKLSEEGQIVEVLEDSEGVSMKLISEVEEKNGKLWIGSVLFPFVGHYDLTERAAATQD